MSQDHYPQCVCAHASMVEAIVSGETIRRFMFIHLFHILMISCLLTTHFFIMIFLCDSPFEIAFSLQLTSCDEHLLRNGPCS